MGVQMYKTLHHNASLIEKNYYVISRSSIFECIAILDVLNDEGMIDQKTFFDLYNQGEELSKILFAMITNLQKKTRMS